MLEEAAKEHTVFVYGKSETAAGGSTVFRASVLFDDNFPAAYPFYIRNKSEYEMEGLTYQLNTIHGAADFDTPGGAVQAAAKLAVKINLASKLRAERQNVLIHSEGQGHFALWLAAYLNAAETVGDCRYTISGRNVLALASTRAAMTTALVSASSMENSAVKSIAIIPSADIFLDSQRLGAQEPFSLTAFFPETVTGTTWQGLTRITAGGGIILVALSSVEAARFDKKKPPTVRRLADIKRNGFRALAYQSV